MLELAIFIFNFIIYYLDIIIAIFILFVITFSVLCDSVIVEAGLDISTIGSNFIIKKYLIINYFKY